MTAYEWLLFIAVIDGPLIALIYYIWKGFGGMNIKYDRKDK